MARKRSDLRFAEFGRNPELSGCGRVLRISMARAIALVQHTLSFSKFCQKELPATDSCHHRTERASRFEGGSDLHPAKDPRSRGEYAPRQERPWLIMSSLSASEPPNDYADLRGLLPRSPIHAVPMASMQPSTGFYPLQERR